MPATSSIESTPIQSILSRQKSILKMLAQSRISRFQSFVAYTQVGIDLKFSTL